MLRRHSVLLVEDDPYVAMDLSASIEDYHGRVVGPTRTATETLELLRDEAISAAVVNWHLPGHSAAPIAKWLAERHIPFVINASAQLDETDRALHAAVPILNRPVKPRSVIARLLLEIRKAARRRRALSETT